LSLLIDLVVHLAGEFGLPWSQLVVRPADSAASPGGSESVPGALGHRACSNSAIPDAGVAPKPSSIAVEPCQ
jgi:hypothetical protein